jgi:hypothetical protein
MSGLQYLCDENVANALIDYLVRREPAIDVIRVGEPGAPPRSTPDPLLLLDAEANGRVLITQDKKTMPQHVADHLAAGHLTCGVIILRSGFSVKRYVDDLILFWAATQPDEWQDRLEYIPW